MEIDRFGVKNAVAISEVVHGCEPDCSVEQNVDRQIALRRRGLLLFRRSLEGVDQGFRLVCRRGLGRRRSRRARWQVKSALSAASRERQCGGKRYGKRGSGARPLKQSHHVILSRASP
jgi:hypothetical protein